jgi:hypothetical protein
MQSLPLVLLPLDGSVEVRGAFDLDRTPHGVLPRRLPAWTRPQLPDLFVETMVTMTAGVRLVFATDSDSVELVSHPRTINMTAGASNEVGRPPVFQMLVNGELRPDVVAHGGTYVDIDRTKGDDGISFRIGGTVVSRWEGLGGGYKEIEIWLPTASSVELIDVRIDDGSMAKAVPSRRRRWVHYGSSISHCMDVDRPFDAWPPMVARQLGLELVDFGLAGQCQLDPFMARVIRDTPADVISLKVGINLVNHASMTERTFVPAVHGFIDTIREQHPETPLLVVSPITCPMVETHAGPTVPGVDGFEVITTDPRARPVPLTLVGIRNLLAGVVETRRKIGDDRLHYLDGSRLFGPPDVGLLYDGLHPDPSGYALLGTRFADTAFGVGGPLEG